MYSVKRYFGMVRASGADHFDNKYRDMPLVNKGIFRFTSDGMYLYAFFLFWAIAIGFNAFQVSIGIPEFGITMQYPSVIYFFISTHFGPIIFATASDDVTGERLFCADQIDNATALDCL